MNAVSPTRSTRTSLALSCWQTAGVARTSMMSKSKYEKSGELNGFTNPSMRLDANRPNFAGYHKLARRVGIGRLFNGCLANQTSTTRFRIRGDGFDVWSTKVTQSKRTLNDRICRCRRFCHPHSTALRAEANRINHLGGVLFGQKTSPPHPTSP